MTIKPREKYPLGQTVLRVNEQRELTKQFTRQYLEEQLLTALAGMRTALQLLGSDDAPLTAYCCCCMSMQECLCLLLKFVLKQSLLCLSLLCLLNETAVALHNVMHSDSASQTPSMS